MGRKFIDLSHQKFGNLTALEKLPKIKTYRGTLWRCLCDCGKESTVDSWHLRKGNIKSCGCQMNKVKSESSSWKGYGEISGQFFNGIKRQRRNKTIEFQITIEFAWEKYLQQNKKCALSGVLLEFGKNNSLRGNASLDRIDSTKGYIESNVQWVHKDVNKMKNIYNQEYFIEMCTHIAKNKKVL